VLDRYQILVSIHSSGCNIGEYNISDSASWLIPYMPCEQVIMISPISSHIQTSRCVAVWCNAEQTSQGHSIIRCTQLGLTDKRATTCQHVYWCPRRVTRDIPLLSPNTSSWLNQLHPCIHWEAVLVATASQQRIVCVHISGTNEEKSNGEARWRAVHPMQCAGAPTTHSMWLHSRQVVCVMSLWQVSYQLITMVLIIGFMCFTMAK